MTADDREAAHKRIWGDSAEGITVQEADPVAHGQDAMTILREHGVAAYQAYLASLAE